MNEERSDVRGMNDTARMRLAAGLLVLVVSILLLPIGVVLRDSLAGSPAANGFSIAPDTLSDSVSATAGQFRVDESGAATYSIPLYTAPGTAGVAPQLSLNYSSQGGYGPLGKGWSIGGMSAISRCRATREAGDFIVGGVVTDGNPAPVNFTASDRYCLDGQRLLTSSSALCSAVSGMAAEGFFTEIQSFQRVCAYTPSSGASGVAFFTVERKDGSISWYGDRDNSLTANRPDGYVNSTALGKEAFALSWAQTRFQDSTGNYIDYTYYENADSVAGEHLPAAVKYTGRTVLPGQAMAAQAPFAQVSFVYALRAADQRGSGYINGGLATQAHRLVAVQSESDGAQLRYYPLTYAPSAAGSGQDTLTQVQECRDSTLAVCMAPTTFAWSQGKYEFATKEYPANLSFGDIQNWRGFKQGDIDGDGRQDMVFIREGGGSELCSSEFILTAFSVLDSAGRPSYVMGPQQCTTPNGTVGIDQRGDGGWQLFDYNGDGRDDLFISSPVGQGWRLFLSTGRGTAKVFDDSQNVIASLSPAIPSNDMPSRQVQLVDLNGDGLTDVVYANAGEAPVARLMARSGGSFAWGAERTIVPDVNLATLAPAIDSRCSDPFYTCTRALAGPSPKGGFVQLADFNGDAASDLLMNLRDTVTWENSCSCTGPNCQPQIVAPSLIGGTATLTPTACTGAGVDLKVTTYAMTVKAISATTVTVSPYDMIGTTINNVSYADANGDGLTDVFYRASSGADWAYKLNTGTGLLAPVALGVVDFRDLTRFLDVNGDGRADVLYVVNAGNFKTYNVRYALPSGGYGAGTWLPGVPGTYGNALLCEGFACDEKVKVPMFGDFDGDGNTDFMSLRISSAPDLFVSRANTRFSPREVITGITNGLGAQTNIAYAPLTLKDFYRPDTGTRNGPELGRGAPAQDILAPMYAVIRASSSAPVNGSTTTEARLHYRYNGAKTQAGGRGFLGFREVVTVDPNQTGGYVVTKTQYAQSFPFVGQPQQTARFASINQLFVAPACLSAAPTDACFAPRGQPGTTLGGTGFSQSTQLWEAVTDSGAVFAPGVAGPVHPRTSGTLEAAADPFTATQTSWVSTAFTYGSYGNVLQTSVDTYAGSSTTPVSTVITSNAYTDDATAWRLGRLTGSTITRKRPGMPDVVRSAWFGYAMTGPKTGLLVEERTQPNVDVRQDLRKVYTLDDYGNRVASFVCSQQVADCRSTNLQYNLWQWDRIHRYSRQEYDARGRFPARSIELFRPSTATTIDTTQPVEFVTSEVLARDAFGNATEVVGLNNVRSVARFGTLGRAYYAWQQTDPAGTIPNANGTVGVSSVTTLRWCNSGTGAVTCPARARFRSRTVATASPTQWVYYDLLGREVLKVAQGFNAGVSGKDASGVCIEYDAVGRAARTSTPFFLAGTTGTGEPDVASVCTAPERKWATTDYDVLGRPVKVTEANAAVSTMAYSNLTTTSTNARGYTKVEIRNALGELAQATDAAGLSTFYAYDAAGNLGAVTRDAGRGAITSSMGYDALGRKVYMNDPDAGVRYLGYNAVGEQEIEHDGAGNINYSRYDFRGRVTWRGSYAQTASGQVQEHSSSTNFDTELNGIGQEHCSSADGFAYAAWQGQSDKTQVWSRCNSFDSMGRTIASATYIDGVSYSSAVIYDLLGRPQRSQDPSGKWLKTEFGARGQALRLCESSAADASATCASGVATTYLENQETDVFGNMVRDTRGGLAAMQTFRQYDPLTGRLSELCSGSSATNCGIMRDRYVWDSVGNLNWRDRKDYGEDFWYDSVDRFEISRANRVGATNYGYGTGQVTDWQRYDKLGNVCAHFMRGNDATWLNYNGRAGCGLNVEYGAVNGDMAGSPHQVRQDNAYSNFVYDAHGNQTFADSSTGDSLDRTIRYTAQDQAYEIFKGTPAAPNRMARFWYDPSGSRYKREDSGLGIVGTRRTLYVGNLEIVSENGTTTYKRYIGGVLVQNVVNGIAANRYLFTDHIGSIIAATNETGAVLEGGGFNAFGERRTNGSATGITTTGLASTTRGFTGHEMVDGLDVIHMNGRIYDPTLGRFLQADPVIQDTSNPQNWNAYSYVFNNPYRYTDPTGMLGQTERQWLGAIVGIGAAIFTGGASMGWWAASMTTTQLFAITVAAGFASGAIATQSFKGGLYGAFGAALTFGVGWAGAQYNWGAGTMLAQAAAGGIIESIQGGSFGNGFVAAGMAAALMPGVGNIGNPAGRAIVGALIGGTLSAATGGKFVNGAVSGAIQGAMAGGTRSGGTSEMESITVTGCTSDEGDLPAKPNDWSYTPFWEDKKVAYGNPLMDLAAESALKGLPHSTIGEWTGYLEWRGPGYIASKPVLITAKPIGNCYQATFDIPMDAVAIYHSHMRFGRDVTNYQAMNRALNGPGPKDHWPIYGRVPRPNYFRGANSHISVIERMPFSEEPFTVRRIGQ